MKIETRDGRKVVRVKTRAFTGCFRAMFVCGLSDDGQVVVHDDVAHHFTRCHSIPKSTQRRIKHALIKYNR